MPSKTKDAKAGKASKSGTAKKSTAQTPAPASEPKPAQSIHVRHILCEKHARKEEAAAALAAGRDFGDVAREFSEDKARQGGSLGWKVRGSLLPEFERVAFELGESSTKRPVWREVKTGEGYHLVMVEGRK